MLRFLLPALLLVIPASAGQSAEAPAPRPTLAQFAWLAGSWSFTAKGRFVTEQWMPPAGGTMLGMSRTVAGGRTVAHEFIVLREEANGDIVYEAHPSGQAAAEFTLVRWSATEAVFENLAHDFPQRIIYTLADAHTLNAAIEGTRNGELRRVEFPYQRVAPE
jgi:hypothetical protein